MMSSNMYAFCFDTNCQGSRRASNVKTRFTIITLSFGTPYLFTIRVLKFEIVNSITS